MKLYSIVFSPTGGTKQVADHLTGALEGEVTTVDLTDSKQDFRTVSLAKEDVAVISVPSYGGRVPAVAAERLGMVHGNGARAVLVCVYGNRAYEDTLAELDDTAKQAGFQVIAAVAAVAEHSIARQFAAGRPDAKDEKQLTAFAQQIQNKFSTGASSEPALPGNRPYKKSRKSRHGTQAHQGLYRVWCVRDRMPRTGHPQGRSKKGGRKGMHLLYALHRCMPAGRSQGKSCHALGSQSDAEKGML